MSTPTGKQVINLYRDLIRYGKYLKYTDQEYFIDRIRREFHRNKSLSNPEDIKFCYDVSIFTSEYIFVSSTS